MTAPVRDRVIHSPFPDFDVGNSHTCQLIEEGLSKSPNKIIAVDAQQSLEAKQFLAKIRRYAVGYRKHGLKPGSRVCTHLRNTVENLAAALGVVFVGGTLIMAKTSYVARELMYTIRDSECEYVLADKETAPNVMRAKTPESIKKLFSVGKAPGFIDVLEFQKFSESSFKTYVPAATEKEDFVMLYTSGTTGLPKAVEISHKSYVSGFCAARAAGLFTEDDIVLAWNPITHISGIFVDIISLCLGARIIVTDPLISNKDFMNVIKTHQVSVFLGIPERMREIVNDSKMDSHPTVGIQKIIVAGTKISKTLGTDTCKLFGVKSFINFYGLTETFGFVSCTPVGKISLDNAGFPCAGTKVKIIDLTTGEPLGPYQNGEIVVQSKNVMKGYYGHLEATRDALSSDGWLRSGDIGYYDNDGQIYIVERLKQMIKCMGNVVTPAELEEILMSHEAVLEAAVIGVPSSEYGEAPVACVVVKEGKEELLESLEAELKELVAGQTSIHKHLYGGVVFMKSLPRTENGKILRQKLKSSVIGRFTQK